MENAKGLEYVAKCWIIRNMRTPCHIHTSVFYVDHTIYTYTYCDIVWRPTELVWQNEFEIYKEKQHLDLLCGNIKLDPWQFFEIGKCLKEVFRVEMFIIPFFVYIIIQRDEIKTFIQSKNEIAQKKSS